MTGRPRELWIPSGATTTLLLAGAGCAEGIAQALSGGTNPPPSAIFLISDRTVADLHGDRLMRALSQLSTPIARIAIPPGEKHKTLQSLERTLRAMARQRLDRDSVIVALGGGMVTDLAGLAAALFLRGVRYASVPTTLLAQVDAAIGGKTAVDLPEGKNLCGAFWPPFLVLQDSTFLSTLPPDEWRSGLGEVFKYGVLAGEEPLVRFESFGPRLLERDPAACDDVLYRCVEIKRGLVADDPLDRGQRQLLNLGHTFGHAIEAASEYRLKHGEAVALGILAEAALARLLGLSSVGLSKRLEAACRAMDLPRSTRLADLDATMRFLSTDKKRARGRMRFALPLAPGDVRLFDVDDESAMRRALSRVLRDGRAAVGE